MRWAGFLGGAFLTLSTASASAATLSAADILSQFNAVIFGNFTSSADVEGRTVIGGNMTGGATFNLNPGNVAASSFSALTVYGNETGGGTYNVNRGGGFTVAGTNSGTFNLNGGGSAYVGGTNSGGLNTSSGNGSITVGGNNSGTLSAGNGASVFVGGTNNANVSVAGSGSIAVLGANSGTVSLSNGGSVYAGSSSGNVSVNGGTGSVSVNGSNTGQLTLNSGGTVKLNGNTGNISLNGGSVVYTGSVTGNMNLNGGATATHVANAGISTPATPTTTLPSFSSTFQAPMTALSTQLAGVAANSTVLVSGNSIAFNAAPDATGTAVFKINTSLFAANSTVTINLDGATSVIINVNVDTCVSSSCVYSFLGSVNFISPTSYADEVIWNFVNATGITFASEFGGTVLAPLATVTNNSPIDGTLVAQGYNGSGELHSYSYTGKLPGAVATPEPASMLLLGAGLAGLGAVRRWRRKR